jgi:DNA modification methylase
VKPYYEHGGVVIYHGDCREVLPSLGTFDLVLTDPPYGLGIETRNAARDGRPYDRRARAVDHLPVAGDDAPFDPSLTLALSSAQILWGANNYASRLPDTAFWLVWDRKCGRAADSNITEAELAAVIGHRFKTVRVLRHMWAGYQRASEISEGSLHPTQKPVALMAWCLGFFPEAKTVVDPYMGSGPVARACKDAGKRYVGIEIEERYCEIAAKRLAQEVLFA